MTLLDEFAENLLEELDYNMEAENIKMFQKNFHGDITVKILDVYPELSSSKVLVMEWIDGGTCVCVCMSVCLCVCMSVPESAQMGAATVRKQHSHCGPGRSLWYAHVYKYMSHVALSGIPSTLNP